VVWPKIMSTRSLSFFSSAIFVIKRATFVISAPLKVALIALSINGTRRGIFGAISLKFVREPFSPQLLEIIA